MDEGTLIFATSYASIIELYHLKQCGEKSIVHIWSCFRDISQGRRLESSLVSFHFCYISSVPGLLLAGHPPVLQYCEIYFGKIGAVMTFDTFRLTIKQIHASFCRFAHGMFISQHISFKGGICKYNRTLEGSNGPGYPVSSYTCPENLLKRLDIARNAVQFSYNIIQSFKHLVRVLDGTKSLFFQSSTTVPKLEFIIGAVDYSGGIPTTFFRGRAAKHPGQPIGKTQDWIMACSAANPVIS